MSEANKPIMNQDIIVQEVDHGQRIDNFLIKKLKGVPKSLIYRLIRQGKVHVNGKRRKLVEHLAADDVISIPLLRQRLESETIQPKQAMRDLIESSILYEDEYLLVLNKPSGMPVHGGTGVSVGLIELVRAVRSKHPFFELAHRLDRETSGCLIIAKKRSVLKELHDLFKQGRIQKQYLALTKGRWPQQVNSVSLALQKNVLRSGERIVTVNDAGKRALSEFQVLKDTSIASFVSVRLFTGRTHQIRVHAQFCGHPVAGDRKYGDQAFNNLMKDYGLKRLFLHAYEISFQLSHDETPLCINCALDEALQSVLIRLGCLADGCGTLHHYPA